MRAYKHAKVSVKTRLKSSYEIMRIKLFSHNVNVEKGFQKNELFLHTGTQIATLFFLYLCGLDLVFSSVKSQ